MNRPAVAAIAATLLAITMAQAAQAAPSTDDTSKGGTSPRLVGMETLSPADRARQLAQEPLLALNDRVHDVTVGVYDEHFAGAQVDTPNRSLMLYWAGQVPNELGALRSEAARNGVKLVIKPARFSRQQLMKAAAEVMPASELYGEPVQVSMEIDGSGLRVAAGDLAAIARGAKAAKAPESALLKRISATRSRTGIPITLAAGRPREAELTSRKADSSPYWAGAAIRHVDSSSGGLEFCTSGFSMYASGAPSTRFTLTAAHCADFLDGVAISNGVGWSMGNSDFIHELYDRSAAYDLGVVRLQAGYSNSPYIYVGNEPSDGAIPVSGYRSGGVPAGGNYCIHGITAVNCNLISETQDYRCSGWPPEGRCVYFVPFRALTPGTITHCGGDSGGPIYNWTGGTPNSVLAAGVNSFGWTANLLGYYHAPVISEAVGAYRTVPCYSAGGMAVVASAVNNINGLRVVTTSTP